jgi:hypothetical protein
MKKIILTILVFASLTLTACGTSINATAAATSDAATEELPVQTQMLLGSLMLDDTEQAITVTQAAELLPLWQVYQELLTSDTAAQEEMDALVDQIQETMTTEQLQAIEALKLSQQDLTLAMQEQGVVSETVQRDTGTTTVSVPQGAPSGDMPAGDMPIGDMGADMGQVAGSVSTSQTQIVETFPTDLIDALVQLLESKMI